MLVTKEQRGELWVIKNRLETVLNNHFTGYIQFNFSGGTCVDFNIQPAKETVKYNKKEEEK